MATPSDEIVQDLVVSYERGATLAALANQLGVSIPTVTKWIRKGGANIRPRGQRKKVTTVTASVAVTPTTESDVEVSSDSFVDDKAVARTIFQAEA